MRSPLRIWNYTRRFLNRAVRRKEKATWCATRAGTRSAAVGDLNTYAIFAETNRMLIASAGRIGCIMPSGIATDDTTKHFFQDIVKSRSLVSLYHFENEDRIFPAVHHAFRFCLLTISGSERSVRTATFVAYARSVAVYNDPERLYSLNVEDFALLNPNTLTLPTFRSCRDAEIIKLPCCVLPFVVSVCYPQALSHTPSRERGNA